MLNIIRDLIGRKVGFTMVVRNSITLQTSLKLQDLCRSFGLNGVLTVEATYIKLDLEGPRPKLERVVQRLQTFRFSNEPTVLEINWTPYQKQYLFFRVASNHRNLRF